MAEFKTKLNSNLNSGEAVKVVDVRSPEEFQTGSIPGAVNIPTSQVLQRIDEFKSEQPVYVICHSGTRSRLVCLTLAQQGITNVVNVLGGMSAWV